ncbi:MerR family transcriptional regulator [Siminovitchia sediminis]|uniref:MerR family transcriptional regulator n=1 Tax=Siminovitchia sediminis TaxID=1274353 RepID=A0ABW4KH70_9BACI
MITISQLAKKASVTTRTLRYYDSIGLLTPSGTTKGGHRTYNEKEIFRLQQIQFLKKAGFSLKEIKTMLEGEADIAGHLEKQLRWIRSEQQVLKKMERDVVGLLHSYSMEGKLNWSLIIEMLQYQQAGQAEMKQLSQQMFGNHAEEIRAKLPNVNDDNEETKEWIRLLVEVQQMIDLPPESAKVQEIIREIWMKSTALFGDDELLQQQLWDVRKSPEKSLKLGWYPLDKNLLQFLDQAFAVYEQERGKEHDGMDSSV